MNTVDIAADTVVAHAIVFVRVSGLVMTMPALGDEMVPMRVRLLLALALTVALWATVGGGVAGVSGATAAVVRLVATEALVGVFIGLVTRVLFAAMDVAGSIIAQQTGISAAIFMNPQMVSAGTVPAALLSLLAATILLSTGLYEPVLRALAFSYEVMPVGAAAPVDDFARLMATTVGSAFTAGAQFAAPFLLFGFVFQLAAGVLGRLMPQLQVFFVALPLQIILGLALFGAVMALVVGRWSQFFASALADIF